MLVLPALAVWFAFTGGRSPRQVFLRFLLAGCASILLPLVLNKSLIIMYGQGPGMLNANFAYTILGQTMGTNWMGAQNYYFCKIGNDWRRISNPFSYTKGLGTPSDNPWVPFDHCAAV